MGYKKRRRSSSCTPRFGIVDFDPGKQAEGACEESKTGRWRAAIRNEEANAALQWNE